MSRETDPRKLKRMGRRRFLKTLSAFGASVTTLNYITQDALAASVDDLSEEVPYVSRLRHTNQQDVVKGEAPPEYEPQIKTLPRDQWVEIEAAHDAAKKLNKKFRQSRSFHGVTAGVSTKQNARSKQKVISINVKEQPPDKRKESQKAVVENELSSSVVGKVEIDGEVERVEDIPVNVKSKEVQTQSSFDYEYDPVPGGCMMDPAFTEDGNYGTIGTPGYVSHPHPDVPDGYHLVTAGHNVDSVSQGRDVYQPSSPRKIGETPPSQLKDESGFDNTFDAGIINTTESVEHDLAADANDQYLGFSISGIITWDEIKVREGTDQGLEFQGASSGSLYGAINKTIEGYGKAFNVDIVSSRGDSGGPYYETEFNTVTGEQESYIAGIHGWGDGQSYGRGTAIEEIQDKFQVTV